MLPDQRGHSGHQSHNTIFDLFIIHGSWRDLTEIGTGGREDCQNDFRVAGVSIGFRPVWSISAQLMAQARSINSSFISTAYNSRGNNSNSVAYLP